MTRHLEEQQISTAAAGLELESSAARHLDSCVSCRSRVERFRQLAEMRRRSLSAQGPDWAAQKASILEALDEPAAKAATVRRGQVWPRPLLALAAVLVAAVALTSLYRSGAFGSSPPAVAEHDIAVEEVFEEVDALLDDDSIPGLWAVDPLADDGELESLISNGTS